MTSKPKNTVRRKTRPSINPNLKPTNPDATPHGRVMLALMDIEADTASLDDLVAITALPAEIVEQCLSDLVACGRVRQASHG